MQRNKISVMCPLSLHYTYNQNCSNIDRSCDCATRLCGWFIPVYATPILYAGGISIKMVYMTVFAKIMSNHTKIKRSNKLGEDQIE